MGGAVFAFLKIEPVSSENIAKNSSEEQALACEGPLSFF
jgi:hypothetical protein